MLALLTWKMKPLTVEYDATTKQQKDQNNPTNKTTENKQTNKRPKKIVKLFALTTSG